MSLIRGRRLIRGHRRCGYTPFDVWDHFGPVQPELHVHLAEHRRSRHIRECYLSSQEAMSRLPVVVAEIRREVLDLWLPRTDDPAQRPVQVVHLLGEVALDVLEDFAALRHVEGAPLEAAARARRARRGAW